MRRDVIDPFDLPIPRGVQRNIALFRSIDAGVQLREVLDGLAALPQLDLRYSEETEAQLPEIVGGLSVALAHSFKILDPELANPQEQHWERAQRLFDELL